jgi:transcriptional regulator with XRE-family HTH domain
MLLALHTPKELAIQIAERVREDRLGQRWTQAQLAQRSGVSLPTYRLFERTGQISLERLLSIASALGRTAEWDGIFRQRVAQSLDELDPARPVRRRGARARPQRGSPKSEDR